MRILITGASGMLGSNLIYHFKSSHQVTGWYYQHKISLQGALTVKVDLTDLQDVRKALLICRPELIIHCAALTDVDECETNRELAYKINVEATEKLVEIINGSKVKFIYISTDSVYNGAKACFTETDPTSPVNYYGITKLKSEKVVSQLKNYLILRTNFFGWNVQDKQNLAEWILNSLKNGREIQGFKDVFFSCIYTFLLAGILEELIATDFIIGIYNVASSDYCSKYDFAVAIAKRFGYDPNLIKGNLLSARPLIAKRPKSPILDTSKIERLLGKEMPSIQESIDRFFQDCNNGLPQKLKGGEVDVCA